MTYRFCHRCQAELPPHDEGTLIFCTHCGAPQVLLSEELQAQVETQNDAAVGVTDVTASLHSTPSPVWAGAIRCAALAGAIAIGLAALSLLLPPVILLGFLWAIISPVVVIGLFQTRFPLVPITTGFGARLGLLTGLAVGLGLNVVFTIDALVNRFVTHNMADYDKQMTASMDQLHAQAMAQPGAPLVGWINSLSIPEFRASFLLVGVALTTVILLVVTTTGGAFAGFARSRSRA